MPWTQTAYQRYWYLSKTRSLLVLVISVTAVGLLIWLTAKYIADPNWYPNYKDFQPKSGGRRRGAAILLGFLIFAILSLPFWLRVPIFSWSVGQILSYAIIRTIWAFDKRPDFAIGPHGIYGLHHLTYYHLPWHEMLSVQDSYQKIPIIVWGFTVRSFGSVRRIEFEGRMRPKPKIEQEKSWFRKAEPRKIKIVLAPVSGINFDEVMQAVSTFAKNARVTIDRETGLKSYYFPSTRIPKPKKRIPKRSVK